MRLVAGFLLATIALPVGTSPAAAADLGGLLGGFETKCSGTRSFVEYMFSLGKKYTTSGDLSRKVLVPAGFKAAIGKEKVTDKGEYMDISVPLRGTYRGLPVSRLDFSLGNENGIYTVAVVFAAPVKTVEASFGAQVARTQKNLLLKDRDSAPSVEILSDEAGAKVLCNLSN